jgi:hypothetical protein
VDLVGDVLECTHGHVLDMGQKRVGGDIHGTEVGMPEGTIACGMLCIAFFSSFITGLGVTDLFSLSFPLSLSPPTTLSLCVSLSLIAVSHTHILYSSVSVCLCLCVWMVTMCCSVARFGNEQGRQGCLWKHLGGGGSRLLHEEGRVKIVTKSYLLLITKSYLLPPTQRGWAGGASRSPI